METPQLLMTLPGLNFKLLLKTIPMMQLNEYRLNKIIRLNSEFIFFSDNFITENKKIIVNSRTNKTHIILKHHEVTEELDDLIHWRKEIKRTALKVSDHDQIIISDLYYAPVLPYKETELLMLIGKTIKSVTKKDNEITLFFEGSGQLTISAPYDNIDLNYTA